ncbi:MAG: YccF domain-containing protein [Lachnospiraceae bacterium]|nr:YccF domain-containing protein [Lachnospiraceae bacterium]
MGLLGNIIWLVFGGLEAALGFLVLGILWCASVIGIPIGLQCFKFAKLTLCPFGKEVEYGELESYLFFNIIWWIFGGLALSLAIAVVGVVFCLTVIGIPFGLQFFKIAKLALMPIGAEVRG